MTSIPAVKAALTAAFTAALPDSQVINGPAESVSSIKSRYVEVGDVNGTITVTSLDLRRATEQYTVLITVSASAAGYDPIPVTAAALADFETACDAVRADPSLGIDVAAKVEGSFEMHETAEGQGRATVITFPVAIFATT